MTVIPIYHPASTHPQAAVCRSCEVRRHALFGALDAQELDQIHTRIANLSPQPGELIYRRGDTAEFVYTIRAGMVRFERFDELGQRRIVRLAGRGDLIGQEALLHRAGSADAVACTPVQLCRIPRTLVESLSEGQPKLQRELMLRWQQALDDAENWLAGLVFGSARQRVLRLLARLATHADDQAHIWLPSREEMGALLDMSMETASRQISQLRREGVLVNEPPRQTRLDQVALAKALKTQGLLAA